MSKLVFGVGINDVDYVVQKKRTLGYVDGKQIQIKTWICPYYCKWKEMVRRCYSDTHQSKHPTYKGCTLDSSWLYLSNFIKWVENQPNKDWMNCELDKDILFEGNKHYGIETCVFISPVLNRFLTNSRAARGNCLLGVCKKQVGGKFRATCCDPFNINPAHIGTYQTELEAHKAWQAKKHEYACRLAGLQDDPRVAKVLKERYAPNRDWSNE